MIIHYLKFIASTNTMHFLYIFLKVYTVFYYKINLFSLALYYLIFINIILMKESIINKYYKIRKEIHKNLKTYKKIKNVITFTYNLRIK